MTDAELVAALAEEAAVARAQIAAAKALVACGKKLGEATPDWIVRLAETPLEARAAADGEVLARRFHETYERLAPQFGYETRQESAVPWEQVPEPNRSLMIAVCRDVLAAAARDAEKVRQVTAIADELLTSTPIVLRAIAARIRRALDGTP